MEELVGEEEDEEVMVEGEDKVGVEEDGRMVQRV